MAEHEGAFTAEVVAVSPLSTSFIRVVFAGPQVAAYQSLDVGDECLTMRFPALAGSAEAARGDGAWRNYTLRSVDEGTLTVDFVAHEGGAAATWALSAAVGDVVPMTRPRCWYHPPAGTRNRLLAADLTGLPALSRIVEGLAQEDLARTVVVVEVLHVDDVATVPQRPGLRIVPIVGSGNGHGRGVLAERCQEFVPDVDGGYVWFSGEAGECRTIRKHVRSERGYATAQAHCIGYWRFDAERWTEKFAPRSAELLGYYERALAEGRSLDEASEDYDAALERAGL